MKIIKNPVSTKTATIRYFLAAFPCIHILKFVFFSTRVFQDGLCNKESAPSVSSISRVLRGGGHTLVEGDIIDGRPSHSIDGILGKTMIVKSSERA